MRSAFRITFAALGFVAGSSVGASALDADFDGRWAGAVPPTVYCSAGRLTLDVKEGSIVGNIETAEGVTPVAGRVYERGMGSIRVGRASGVIQFDDDGFVADYSNVRCGPRQVLGKRLD